MKISSISLLLCLLLASCESSTIIDEPPINKIIVKKKDADKAGCEHNLAGAIQVLLKTLEHEFPKDTLPIIYLTPDAANEIMNWGIDKTPGYIKTEDGGITYIIIESLPFREVLESYCKWAHCYYRTDGNNIYIFKDNAVNQNIE